MCKYLSVYPNVIDTAKTTKKYGVPTFKDKSPQKLIPIWDCQNCHPLVKLSKEYPTSASVHTQQTHRHFTRKTEILIIF